MKRLTSEEKKALHALRMRLRRGMAWSEYSARLREFYPDKNLHGVN